jgi:prephenate dehydrogenase
MTSPTEPRRAAIIGLGLIGGSIGMGLRRAGWYVSGSDQSEAVAHRALELGAIDAVGSDPDAALTVVATPVSAVPGVVRDVLAASSGAVTDVAGVKASVVAAADHPRFAGGHPMAGSEADGIDGADPDLFMGAVWVLTPTAITDPDTYATVHGAVKDLGADVVTMDAGRHDAMVAVVSHVPHLTAAALMTVASVHAAEEQGPLLRLAAGGFRDMTRISAGRPGIWPDVCADNAEAITAVLDELTAELGRLRDAVAGDHRADLLTTLERARAARLALPARGPRRAADVVEVRVPVANRPGAIVEVAGLATDLGINLEAVETADATEYEQGLVVMVIDAGAAPRLRQALEAKGYRPTVRELG